MIEVSNLAKIYVNDGVETPALNGVSFSIGQGEFVAIMGPSGSGKSTLVQILGLLDRPSGGRYVFEGKDSSEFTENELARLRNLKMGFVFQSFNLLPKATVLENVMLPLLYSDKPESSWKKLALEAIEQVGLSHRLAHESSQLSGGEKQRVAIARALVNLPDVIFADEPTGNLDSKSGLAVMQIIQKLNSRGHTIILITHETYTAEHAERIIRIKDGQIESDEKVLSRKKGEEFIK
ncbi:MAG: macrolide ABC transporter ATP-binding protein [Candidatus Doudnabacteria bacterium RIFCSPHIGHO2_12_FULL_48_11]|uniref:Macrolide ABC transporter ATP-binding protein n=1 Tax=Candidatus Doudnabacteria bacterium RIFCSPHIGHO2_01_FULL_46_24 TaxID=1817825 RepID=A0A1F5NTN1_9BACT|nr:MAG: macrolide ABC transporter ATP-binding protein [Candidatus Doudnabacteria bacterium RIFCSPHIGHO2_01_FULL_46_24]OGE95866.1 MAG: macrolide ABC transporter ATP-binding protein [Candidatus Doudnabacteria bacterium RIFCSPHIGHO2_12_FULL_48_11]